jgi:hypothetical protein
MINTYRYGGHKNLREDNTTQKLEVRPSKILEIKGPFIQVTITHPVSSPAKVKREMILLKSMLKKAAEWYGLNLRTITLDLVKEESRERILSRSEMGLLVATNIKARQWKSLQRRKTSRI